MKFIDNWDLVDSSAHYIMGEYLFDKELEELFPEAIFVRLHRNRVKVAKSILKIRNNSNIGKWFSVFPKECLSYLDSPLHEQISAQVYWINKRLESMNNNRTVHIDFESLCQEPALTINKVITYANNNGFQLEIEKELPSRFQNNSSNQVDENDHIFNSLFTKLEKKHGELNVFDT